MDTYPAGSGISMAVPVVPLGVVGVQRKPWLQSARPAAGMQLSPKIVPFRLMAIRKSPWLPGRPATGVKLPAAPLATEGVNSVAG